MKKTLLLGAMLCALVTLVGCGSDKDDDKNLVGSWEWTGTTVHHVDNDWGTDTTYADNYPDFKDVEFLDGGKANLMLMGAHIPESEPPYFSRQFDYSLNSDGDVIQLTDLSEMGYYPMTWTIKTLDKKNLTIEFTDEVDYFETFTRTFTYRRK